MTTNNPIPTGWKEVRLGDISHKIMYGMNSAATDFDGRHKYIRITDIDEQTHRFSPNPVKSPSGLIDTKYKLQSGDILFARTGASTGKSYLYDKRDGELYFAGFLIRFNIKHENPMYIFSQTLLKQYDNWVIATSTRSGQPGINAEEYKRLPLLLPPLPEQHRIVAVLETWDKAIEKLTRKIELKKNIKKGLMQKLLTGKVRLPGFAEEWVTVELGGVCKITMGQSPASSSYNEEGNGLPLIQGNADIKNRKTIRRIWTTAPSKTSDEGDIILTVRAPVGAVGISQDEVCIGRGVCSIKVKGLNKDFVFCYLILIESNWKSYEQGSTFSAVNSSDVKGLNLFVPKSKAEQTAIADILTTADQEIEALQKKLQLLQQQKQYLLNNLVTGKIRTPENLFVPEA